MVKNNRLLQTACVCVCVFIGRRETFDGKHLLLMRYVIFHHFFLCSCFSNKPALIKFQKAFTNVYVCAVTLGGQFPTFQSLEQCMFQSAS